MKESKYNIYNYGLHRHLKYYEFERYEIISPIKELDPTDFPSKCIEICVSLDILQLTVIWFIYS
jgi:hypothetical protein